MLQVCFPTVTHNWFLLSSMRRFPPRKIQPISVLSRSCGVVLPLCPLIRCHNPGVKQGVTYAGFVKLSVDAPAKYGPDELAEDSYENGGAMPQQLAYAQQQPGQYLAMPQGQQLVVSFASF